MEAKNLIGKKIKVQIIGITNNEKYFVAKSIEGKHDVYIENTKDYELEEIQNTIQECVIINVIKENLIAFLISDRKFINDMKRIEANLKEKKEYNNVKDIYLMERLKIKNKVLGLYLVDKGDVGIYYLDSIEIGKYIKREKENNIVFKEKKIENELGNQIRDVVKSIDLIKKEISLNQEREKEKHLIEKAIGLEMIGEITKIATVDLKQKINERQEEQDRRKNQISNIKTKEKEYSKEKDINIKQQMYMKNKVTDMKTLGQLLKANNKLPNIEGKKFVKMGVIESADKGKLINEKGEKSKINTTRYSFVAIANDGTVVPLDLSQDHQEGNNPREVNYQVNQKGKVKQDDVKSRFNIGKGTFAIKNGEYGEIKVYHSPRKTIGGKGIEGNKSLDRELETDNVWALKKGEKDLAGEYKTGYRSVEKGYKEAKLHEDEKGKILKGDDVRTEDVDGNKNTKSHAHDNVNYSQLATKWGYYKQGKPNEEKAKQLYQEKREKNPGKEEKEIIEMVTQDLEEEMAHNRGGR